MKKITFIYAVGLCILLSSCAGPREASVRTIVDMDREIQTEKVIIVSDAGKKYGKTFGDSFIQNIKLLTQGSKQDVSVMTYIDFIRSDYNDPDKKNAFSDTLFVFVEGHSIKYTKIDYSVYAKYLGQSPIVSKEITIIYDNSPFSPKAERGKSFAKTVYKELQSSNIL